MGPEGSGAKEGRNRDQQSMAAHLLLNSLRLYSCAWLATAPRSFVTIGVVTTGSVTTGR